MAVGMSCLLKDPEIVEHLGLLMKYEAQEHLPFMGKDPTLNNIYDHFRGKLGIEVDLQTVGEIYKNVFRDRLNEKGFTRELDVNKQTGKTIADIVKKQQAIIRANEIGKNNPVISAINNLASLVQPDTRLNPTVQKIFQERLTKAIRKTLGIKAQPHEKTSMVDMLKEVLLTEKSNPLKAPVADGSSWTIGYLKNAEVLWKNMQTEVDNVATEMEKNSSFGADQFRAYADQIKQASYDLFFSQREVEQVVNETLKQNGFAKVMKVNGESRLVMDWQKVLKISLDFPTAITKVLEQSKFSKEEIERLVPYFEKQFNNIRDAKIAEGLTMDGRVKKTTDIEKLAEIARMGVYDSTEKKLIYGILGVKELDKAQMKSVDTAVEVFNKIASANPEAQWSSVFTDSISRHIRVIVEQAQEGQHAGLNVVRHLAMLQQWTSSTLLDNVGNMVENITSGFSGMSSHLITSLVSNPRAIPDMLNGFTRTFWDVVKGGTREGMEQLNIYEKGGNIEDRTSNEVLKKKTGLNAVWQGLNIIQRATLSGMDSAVKASIFRTVESEMHRRVLEAQGLTREEAHEVMNQTYYGNRKELENVAKTLEKGLVAAGVDAAKGKWKRMASQMAVANMITGDGTYMDKVLENVLAKRKYVEKLTDAEGHELPDEDRRAQAKKEIQVNEDLVNTIRNAAYNVAGRELGHKEDVWGAALVDRPLVAVKSHADEARKTGNYGMMAKQEAYAMGMYSMFKFRSGGLRWLFLNYFKSSYLPAIQTLLTDGAIGGQHKLLKQENLKQAMNDLSAAGTFGAHEYDKAYKVFGDNLEKAFAMRSRLGRSVIQPLVGYAAYKFVVQPILDKAVSYVCSGTGADCLQKKTLFIKQHKWDAFITKMAPIALQSYLESFVKNDGYGHYKMSEEEPVKDFETFATMHPGEAVMEYIGYNWNDDPIYGAAARLVTDMGKQDWKAGADELGKFVGHSLNLGGPMKMWDIDKHYYKSERGMFNDHYDSKLSNQLTSGQRKDEKADNVWQEIAKQNLTEAMYDTWVKGIPAEKQH